jgi:hypothetical protein
VALGLVVAPTVMLPRDPTLRREVKWVDGNA